MIRQKFKILVAIIVILGCQGAGRVGVATAQTLDNLETRNQIRKALVTLPYYGVFDNLEANIQGGTVVLEGQVVKPITKGDAESRVAKIKGVDKVINNIKVLPLSGVDNQLRRQEYRAIFRSPGLQRYSMGTNPSIHIIVENGHVTLVGIVDSETDKNLAGLRANGVSGVFSVTNNLSVETKNK
jgi:hyperosmotically inducible protein